MTGVFNVGNQAYPVWHNDKELSGGGVLLRNSYEIIDQIIWNFAIPQEVYSLITNTAGDRQQRHYSTEDTAIVTMKFRDDLIGNLTASKVFGPNETFLKAFSKDKILTVSNNYLSLSRKSGQIIEELKYKNDKFLSVSRVLENFALSILLPDKNPLSSSGRENLKNMSVIESFYLSARTGMPESPAGVLRMGQIKPISI